MRFLSTVVILALVSFAGCSMNKGKSAFADSATVTRIKVTRDGAIYLNGAPASLEDVNKNLEQLKANKGRVRYYRDNPGGPAPEQALKVMQAVIDAKVPIKLCTSEEDLNGTQ